MKIFNKLMVIAYFVVLYLTSTSFAGSITASVFPIFTGPRSPYGPTTLIRSPSLDSAVFQSDRIGGNFAYSTIEGHAYTAITPFIQQQYFPTASQQQQQQQQQYQQPSTFYTSPSLAELSSIDDGNNQQYESQQQYEQQQYDLQQQQQYQTYNLYSPNIVRNILF